MRLRPYKSCDSMIISNWIQDKEVFDKWGGERFGKFPINSKIIDDKYRKDNGDCSEPDNFYPWVAIDDYNQVVGHFIMRYTDGNLKHLRFGWVIVDHTIRQKGYGKQMLSLGLKYAFDIFDVDKVTIGVYEHNHQAYWCYKNIGFKDKEIVKGEPENIIEMELLKKDYYQSL